MGSSISAVIAEIVMQHVEKKFLQDCPVSITIWKRYVEDVLAIIPTEKEESLQGIASTINSFTIEK